MPYEIRLLIALGVSGARKLLTGGIHCAMIPLRGIRNEYSGSQFQLLLFLCLHLYHACGRAWEGIDLNGEEQDKKINRKKKASPGGRLFCYSKIDYLRQDGSRNQRDNPATHQW